MNCAGDFALHEPQWCPGCGNFELLDALKQALCDEGLRPEELIVAAGIGQASKLGFSLKANLFNGIHGRMLPLALGMKMANHEARVLVVSGDGCFYAEGGNHFLHNLRRNLNVLILASDNRVYGLTKGQASPTAADGFTTKVHPEGTGARELNPTALALVAGATFVAKTFTGRRDELIELIRMGLGHRGTAFIDIMSPCPSFNKVNTFAWYKSRITPLPADHDPTDHAAALAMAMDNQDKIATGLYYRVERPVFGDHLSALRAGPIAARTTAFTPERVRPLFARFK